MSLKMSEFQRIDPAQVTSLATAGIENTDDLMKVWSDKEQRPGLVTRTGIPEENFMKFAAMARLGRVKGMSLQNLDVLVAAGIDGPKRLFSYTPETLERFLNEMAVDKKLTGTLPTTEEIAAWFANPRPATNGNMAPGSKPESDTKPEGAIVH
jgi:aminoglycoside phosphotransferase (APT) family kinase protein